MVDILWLVFFCAVAIQLFYLIFIFGRLAFFYQKPPELPLEANPERVTVIVAARNEVENLKQLLPKLFAQDYKNLEILIVNDQSTDGTEDLLLDYAARYPSLRAVHVRYTPNHVTSKKYALTLGIKVASSDIMLLTDADCIPVSDRWVTRMTAPIRLDNKVFAIGHGSYRTLPGILNKLIQFETMLTALYYFSFGLWKSPFMGVGRNLCYRRSFFMEQKAFNGLWHILGGDDDLFVNKYANKKNTALVIHPESITLSSPKTDFSDFLVQKRRHFQAGKYYRLKDKLKLGIYSLTHLVYWFSAIILVAISTSWEPIALVLGFVFTRALLQYTIIRQAKIKLEGMGKVLWTMFFDVMYMIYFWVVGTKGYLSKTVKWK
jgi:cellulose synthase/poly-beta-1,6-N-acetylglucosamine synthase-like glycosyltransferase